MTDIKNPDGEARADKVIELSTVNFEALGVIEHDGKLHLPTKLRERTATGGIRETEILLMIPTNAQLERARLKSYEMFAEAGYDPEVNKETNTVRDQDRLDEIENYCILWFAIRDPDTKGQFEVSPEELFSRFPANVMGEVWERFKMWVDVVDPRYGKLTDRQLWECTAAIAKGGNMLPLSVMLGPEQATCITVMALAACESPSAPSWLNSPSTSAPAT